MTTRTTLATRATGPDALRCPELHDFSDMPSLRPSRIVVALLIVGALLTGGHFLYQHHGASLEANTMPSVGNING